MRLFEHEAKQLCVAAGFLVPAGLRVGRGGVIPSSEKKRWLKAQVLLGNRFGAGLVVSVPPGTDPTTLSRDLLQKVDALGQVDDGFLIEDETPFDRAWYVSLTWDRESRAPIAHVRSGGGTGIEGRAEGGFDGSRDQAETYDWTACEIPPDGIDSFRSHLMKLFDLFTSEDLTLLEINPLVFSYGWIALDAKVITDGRADEAHKRPDRSPTGLVATAWEQETRRSLASGDGRGTFALPQELSGDILSILSGGGASLVAMDALLEAGGRPANYLEFSGNPSREGVRALARAAMTKKGIKGVWIAGAAANFTDVAETMAGVLEAYETSGLRVPIVVRRDGPHAERAKAESESWAAARGIKLIFDRSDVSFLESAKKIVQLAYGK